MFAVTAQRADERADATAADERHHHVDAVSGVNLSEKLAADPRLTWSVRKKRRVEKRDKRLFDEPGAAVGAPTDDAMQHRTRFDRSVGCGVARDQLVETNQQLAGDVHAHLDPPFFVHTFDRSLDDLAEMEGEPIRCLRRPQVRALRPRAG